MCPDGDNDCIMPILRAAFSLQIMEKIFFYLLQL